MSTRTKSAEQVLPDERSAKAQAIAPAKDRRAEKRKYYQRVGVSIEVQQAGGKFNQLLVTTRDLSSRGLGFLYTGLLFPKALCKISLPRGNDEPHVVEGRISSCRRVEGDMNEVGVLFNNRVDEEVLKTLLPDLTP